MIKIVLAIEKIDTASRSHYPSKAKKLSYSHNHGQSNYHRIPPP